MLKIFKDKKLIYVAAIVSLFLQIISFVTTYQGASYYFKEIFILSPLLFALAVQSVVYFLENSIRHSANFTKILSLVLAILCSSYFSYIGIYNTVNSPLSYYQQTYTTYKTELETDYENLVSQADDTASRILKNAASAITDKYTSLKIQKNELKSIINELDSVSAGYSSSMTAPAAGNYDDYESYAAAYQSYINSVSKGSSSEIKSSTRNILKKYGYKDRLQVVNKLSNVNGSLKSIKQSCKTLAVSCGLSPSSNVTANIEKINAKLTKEILSSEMLSSAILNSESANSESANSEISNLETPDSTDASVNSSDGNLASNISKFIGLANNYKSSSDKFDSNKVISCVTLHKSLNKNILREYKDIATDNPSECKNILLQELNDGIIKLNRICSIIGTEYSFNKNDYSLDDIYVIPLLRLVQPETSAIAVSCLLIAMLTDVLSLLFAMMFCSPFRLLKLCRYNKVLNDESLFEENISSAISLSMHLQNDNIMPDSKTLQDEQLRHLADFINLFETVPHKLGRKYILCAKMEKLNNYQTLIAVLCQLKLAKIMPAWQYERYNSAFNKNNDNADDETSDIKNYTGNIVLLKLNFLLWCNTHWTKYDSAG